MKLSSNHAFSIFKDGSKESDWVFYKQFLPLSNEKPETKNTLFTAQKNI